MTALQSWRALSAFHIFPESRIIAGMEASTMMSLGTCRLVMPLSESTMAIAGPAAIAAAMSASIAARSASGSDATRASTSARPSLGFAPTDSSAAACLVNTSAKKVCTA